MAVATIDRIEFTKAHTSDADAAIIDARDVVKTYSSGNASTTTYLDDKGHPTSSTTTAYNSDGSQTVTTKSYDDKGKETTQSQVTYGQESPGVGNHPDSPGEDATNQLNDQLKHDMGDKAPKILAPGAPGQQGSSGQGVTA